MQLLNIGQTFRRRQAVSPSTAETAIHPDPQTPSTLIRLREAHRGGASQLFCVGKAGRADLVKIARPSGKVTELKELKVVRSYKVEELTGLRP